MRKDLFLHFLNRDTREIFGLYRALTDPQHALAIREPLNAAAILCEDCCIAPPGFVIEDQIAFELFEQQAAFLEHGLVRLPYREPNLEVYAEKKRGEYAPARSRYSGLFDDDRMRKLSSYGQAMISRKVQIGPAIVDGFEGGVDTKAAAWQGIRKRAPADVIADLRSVPRILADEGKALTWSIMLPQFSAATTSFHQEMRGALQHVYFQEYCREFKLKVVSDIPFMIDVFFLPHDRHVYNFRRFKSFLHCFEATKIFLRGSANQVMQLRRQVGFTDLIDSYVALARAYPTDTNLTYYTTLAVRKATFDWVALSKRMAGTFTDPTLFEIQELGDACAELSGIINSVHGFSSRSQGGLGISTALSLIKVQTPTKTVPAAATVKSSPQSSKGPPLKILMFVALEEELDVLEKYLDLKRPSGQPATGTVGGVPVDVICPRSMGRVSAAVAVTSYLAKAEVKPDLVLCVGLAGGFQEAKIEQGAVICVDTVVDLATRKITDDEAGQTHSRFRRQDFHCKRKLYEVAKSNDFDSDDWEAFCRREFDWPRGKTPSLWEGNIASADEVVASDGHRKKMVESGDKLLGVEMEAGGVCAAARSFDIPFEVVRVVSDQADPVKTDDMWRKTGMKTLAELLKRLPMERVVQLAKGG